MPDIFDSTEKLMGMNDRIWARHANPWSVYSRIWGGVFIFFAIWGAHWIGWLAAAPIALAVAWVWINPRLFPPPKTADSWATKGVLGERAFINRKTVHIPFGFQRAGWATTGFAMFFLLLFAYGLITGAFWTGLAGWFGALTAKLWFFDRMAWLWEEMKDSHPMYRAWARADWTADAVKRP